MNMLKLSVLSISLATVTSGAAVSPALGLIAKYFSNEAEIMIKLIITIPSIMIIFTSFIFAKLSKIINAKYIAMIGFCLFLVGGVFPYFLNNIYLILISRAILGIGAGFLTPLSVSLIGILFEKHEQVKLMSLSGMCNQLGAVITVSISGFLASLSWQFSFLIYFFIIFIFLLNIIYLPKVMLSNTHKELDKRNLKIIYPFYISLFLTQVLFFNFTNNFSIIYEKEKLINPSFIGILMGSSGICGAFVSFKFSKLFSIVKEKIRYIGALGFLIAFLLFSIRFSENYYVFNLNLMLIIGIIACFFNGSAVGILMPFAFSQISIKSKKSALSTNMAIASACVFSGQFCSPFIDEIFMHLFNLHHPRDAFLIAALIALCLFIYNFRVKIKLNSK